MLLKPVGFLKSSAGFGLIQSNVVISDETLATSFTSGSSYAPAPGSDRLALLMVSIIAGATAPTTLTVSWGATSFTVFQSTITGTNRPSGGIFYIKDADLPGSNTITVTTSTNVACHAALLEYGGVNQTTPFGANFQVTNDTGTGGTLGSFVTMTSADGLQVGMVSFRNSSEALVVASPSTKLEGYVGASNTTAWGEEFPGAVGSNEINFSTPTDPPQGRLRLGCELLPA